MTPSAIRAALEAHAAACREAIAALRPRPGLDAELRANLAGAYLADANLADAKGIRDVLTIARIGSRHASLTAILAEDGAVTVTTGCFRGTLSDLAAAVDRQHGDNEHGRAYRAAIALIRVRFGAEEAQP